MLTNEHGIIQKARNGDQKAYKKLYELYVDRVYRLLRQYSDDIQQVEDWVQRAFIKAYQHLHTFKEDARFSTWLISIALNEMRSDFRRNSVFVLPEHELPEQYTENEEEQFAWRDAMRALLQQLDEQKRSVFLLYEVEGYSHAEIAVLLHISESASRTILCRTKETLRIQWEHLEKAI